MKPEYHFGTYARGAAIGLVVALCSEVVRFYLDGSRTLSDAAWSLWLIPFGALVARWFWKPKQEMNDLEESSSALITSREDQPSQNSHTI